MLYSNQFPTCISVSSNPAGAWWRRIVVICTLASINVLKRH